MGKVLECQCGFNAGGPECTVDELKDVALAHIRVNHPELITEHGEEGVRDLTPRFVRDTA